MSKFTFYKVGNILFMAGGGGANLCIQNRLINFFMCMASIMKIFAKRLRSVFLKGVWWVYYGNVNELQ